MVVFAELGAGQNSLVNLYTFTGEQRERWRIHRKLMHQGVGVQAVRRVARTLADLAREETVDAPHVAQALALRASLA